MDTNKLQFRSQFRSQFHKKTIVGSCKSSWLDRPQIPAAHPSFPWDGLCSGLSLSPCPQASVLGSPRRREGAVLAVLVRFAWEWECGLVGSVLAAAGRCKVPVGASRTVPPSTNLEHHPPAHCRIRYRYRRRHKKQLRRFLAENASPWSRCLAEPLPQAIDQADDVTPDSVACPHTRQHHGRRPAPEPPRPTARTGQTA